MFQTACSSKGRGWFSVFPDGFLFLPCRRLYFFTKYSQILDYVHRPMV